ncbi:homoserine O-acetyltransferase [Microcella daejeonensis]|uniref:Homoserine O-acetyltransferase n=1 Tax=Microcella daejeonensis TaxID=2994971 RepID=A0A9E8MJW1_9MICO|nr:homoserine O-acetyltransferase [Microcella daejeonensis]WAB80910.1 homoserine O-acetyltransferase [Microcella daejeonensis]
MDWQTSEDTVPSAFITEASRRALSGAPPVTGAWREGDPAGGRVFENLGPLELESGARLPHIRLAYESWGERSPSGDNVVLLLHALTGDSHVVGRPGNGHPTAGWWSGIVGPGLAIDTDRWFVLAPNMLGGCQGSTGPASFSPDGAEWGSRFPYLTIRDQVAAQRMLVDRLGIDRLAAVVGGSMGGMHAIEWAATHPERVERLAVLAAPAVSTADQIALNSVQLEAIRMDPAFHGGDYYDEDEGPYRGLALARRMALLNYRSPDELNERFERSWQGVLDPLGAGGRFAIESYLDFHGNKFTRRFDAGSYSVLVEAMNSHDITRGRGELAEVLAPVSRRSLVLGIDSDRLFPVEQQQAIARALPGTIHGDEAIVISSPFGHDAFLIEDDLVGPHLRALLES